MVNIYCLIDPRTSNPFYVGATSNSLPSRLSAHILEAKQWSSLREVFQHGPSRQKQLTIILLLYIKQKPQIVKLAHVHAKEADHYEKFFYEMFIHQGFELHQKATAFHYYASYANPKPIRRKFWLPNNGIKFISKIYSLLFGNLSRNTYLWCIEANEINNSLKF